MQIGAMPYKGNRLCIGVVGRWQIMCKLVYGMADLHQSPSMREISQSRRCYAKGFRLIRGDQPIILNGKIKNPFVICHVNSIA